MRFMAAIPTGSKTIKSPDEPGFTTLRNDRAHEASDRGCLSHGCKSSALLGCKGFIHGHRLHRK